jgi:hypothetical protein
MWNVFENSWLLLTLAGLALVAASIYRQAKPEHGYWPLLIPVVLAGIGFGLDYAVTTDYEAIQQMISECKNVAVANGVSVIGGHISPNYRDSAGRNKAQIEDAMKLILNAASVEKVRVMSHNITINGRSAKSEFEAAVHLGQTNTYTSGVSFMYVGLEFGFEKIGDKWFIQRAEVRSVNNQPMNWSHVR